MTNSIKVSCNEFSWNRTLSDHDFKTAKGALKSETTVNIFTASLIPVRTNNWLNFKKDFFLPTVINHAIMINNVVARFFAVLGALLLDIPTFIIRLITALPRKLYNDSKPENAFRKYLKGQADVPQELLNADEVHVRLDSSSASESTNPDGTLTRNSKSSYSETLIRFIATPGSGFEDPETTSGSHSSSTTYTPAFKTSQGA